jgi:DNA-binding transcriptional regulator LsrR (DeoR family)
MVFSRLQSQREIAATLGLTKGTVQRALEQASAANILTSTGAQ